MCAVKASILIPKFQYFTIIYAKIYITDTINCKEFKKKRMLKAFISVSFYAESEKDFEGFYVTEFSTSKCKPAISMHR